MKAKISRGAGFRGALNYVLNPEKDARRVGGNLAGATPRELSAEFSQVRALRPDIARPVWHCSLSLPPGEHLDDHQWQQVTSDYMQRMGFSDATPWIAVRHQDTEHEHIHIVASRIGLDGKIWLGQRDVHRAIDVTQALERAHGLTVTPGLRHRAERRAETAAERGRATDDGFMSVRRQIQRAIDRELPDRPTAAELAKRLETDGIEMRVHMASTGRVSGVSFAVGNQAYKGSALGKRYSWTGLQRAGMVCSDAASLKPYRAEPAGQGRAEEPPAPAPKPAPEPATAEQPAAAEPPATAEQPTETAPPQPSIWLRAKARVSEIWHQWRTQPQAETPPPAPEAEKRRQDEQRQAEQRQRIEVEAAAAAAAKQRADEWLEQQRRQAEAEEQRQDERRASDDKARRATTGSFRVVINKADLDRAQAYVISIGGARTAEIGKYVGKSTLVVDAVDADNLCAVAEALRQRYPNKPIVIDGWNNESRAQQVATDVSGCEAVAISLTPSKYGILSTEVCATVAMAEARARQKMQPQPEPEPEQPKYRPPRPPSYPRPG
ncbi:MAG: relaxase/mobilization nuclease domain-containing protein [Bacteroidales bacterium]|nr:relaxase/mobilization nuclease domain-containing protein [Bacteroidales bacterium]